MTSEKAQIETADCPGRASVKIQAFRNFGRVSPPGRRNAGNARREMEEKEEKEEMKDSLNGGGAAG